MFNVSPNPNELSAVTSPSLIISMFEIFTATDLYAAALSEFEENGSKVDKSIAPLNPRAPRTIPSASFAETPSRVRATTIVVTGVMTS